MGDHGEVGVAVVFGGHAREHSRKTGQQQDLRLIFVATFVGGKNA